MLFLISVMGYCKRFDSLKIYGSGLKKVYDRLFRFGKRSKKDARAMPFINLCTYIFAGKDLPINAERIMKFFSNYGKVWRLFGAVKAGVIGRIRGGHCVKNAPGRHGVLTRAMPVSEMPYGLIRKLSNTFWVEFYCERVLRSAGFCA